MRSMIVITLLAALIHLSGQTHAASPSDTSIADFLRPQAAQGDPEAQYLLGLQYALGNGVPQDHAMARNWWEKAAAQGHPNAQNNLGLMYFDGRGVPQDHTKAREWYEKAAAQNDVNGQYNLGLMYEYGNGMPRDDVRAYMWYSLVAAHLLEPNMLAAEESDRVARRMTPAQVAEAKRLAQQCQARQFKGC
jgi:uncharacterized protein